MVVFTCNYCGDTLQKPKVAKHYQFQCRKAPSLTCMDCLKDFRNDEYVVHIKCITEAERYGGKDYVPKSGANKGERKQQEWICVVNSLLNGTTILSNAERNFLNSLSKFNNIPKKKAKFLNFVHNAIGNRVNMTIVESVWNKLESAHKQNQPTVTQTNQENGKTNETNLNMDSNNTLSNNLQENIVENQNNENICRENGSTEQSGNTEIYKTDGDEKETLIVVKKKSKKRQLSESVISQEEQPATKAKKTSTVTEVPKTETHKVTFDWKCTILDIVQNKGEISLRKLQKKVISRYINHCSNNVEREKAIAKFNKKMKKIPEISISENLVKILN